LNGMYFLVGVFIRSGREMGPQRGVWRVNREEESIGIIIKFCLARPFRGLSAPFRALSSPFSRRPPVPPSRGPKPSLRPSGRLSGGGAPGGRSLRVKARGPFSASGRPRSLRAPLDKRGNECHIA
jgi:hypothetical protein